MDLLPQVPAAHSHHVASVPRIEGLGRPQRDHQPRGLAAQLAAVHPSRAALRTRCPIPTAARQPLPGGAACWKPAVPATGVATHRPPCRCRESATSTSAWQACEDAKLDCPSRSAPRCGPATAGSSTIWSRCSVAATSCMHILERRATNRARSPRRRRFGLVNFARPLPQAVPDSYAICGPRLPSRPSRADPPLLHQAQLPLRPVRT